MAVPALAEATHKACLGDDPKEYTNTDKLLSVAQAEGCALFMRSANCSGLPADLAAEFLAC